jgi:hypothetical protein
LSILTTLRRTFFRARQQKQCIHCPFLAFLCFRTTGGLRENYGRKKWFYFRTTGGWCSSVFELWEVVSIYERRQQFRFRTTGGGFSSSLNYGRRKQFRFVTIGGVSNDVRLIKFCFRTTGGLQENYGRTTGWWKSYTFELREDYGRTTREQGEEENVLLSNYGRTTGELWEKYGRKKKFFFRTTGNWSGIFLIFLLYK